MNLEYLDKIELAHSKLILRNDQIVQFHLEDNFYFILKESLEMRGLFKAILRGLFE